MVSIITPFDDGAQAARAALALDGLFGDGAQAQPSVELELHAVQIQQIADTGVTSAFFGSVRMRTSASSSS